MTVVWPDKVRCQCGAMTRNLDGVCCLCADEPHAHPDPHDREADAFLTERYER